jgi:hypothetical protein
LQSSTRHKRIDLKNCGPQPPLAAMNLAGRTRGHPGFLDDCDIPAQQLILDVKEPNETALPLRLHLPAQL